MITEHQRNYSRKSYRNWHKNFSKTCRKTIDKIYGVSWEDLKVDLQEIPQALRYLGILPENGVKEEKDTYVYFDATEGEYMPIRGSGFDSTSYSGPSALYLSYPRSHSYGGVGFRSAFYEVNGKLITE